MHLQEVNSIRTAITARLSISGQTPYRGSKQPQRESSTARVQFMRIDVTRMAKAPGFCLSMAHSS